jgi:hypothetical protein
MTEQKKYSTEYTNEKFKELLKEFNDLVKERPKAETIKLKLLEIKAKATDKDADYLTVRQRAAIVDRVDNYFSGKYKM